MSVQSLLAGDSGAALDEEARARLRAGLVCAIELAGRFGIPNLVFGTLKQRVIPAGLSSGAPQDMALSFFREPGEVAQTAGPWIAIEAIPAACGTDVLATLDEAARFVALAGHPAIVPILALGAMHMDDAYPTAPGLGRACTMSMSAKRLWRRHRLQRLCLCLCWLPCERRAIRADEKVDSGREAISAKAGPCCGALLSRLRLTVARSTGAAMQAGHALGEGGEDAPDVSASA